MKLSDGSKESARILAEIVGSGEEKIGDLNDEFRKVEEGKDDFAAIMDELENDYSNKMDEITRKMNDSMKELNVEEDAKETGRSNIRGLINGTNVAPGLHERGRPALSVP